MEQKKKLNDVKSDHKTPIGVVLHNILEVTIIDLQQVIR